MKRVIHVRDAEFKWHMATSPGMITPFMAEDPVMVKTIAREHREAALKWAKEQGYTHVLLENLEEVKL